MADIIPRREFKTLPVLSMFKTVVEMGNKKNLNGLYRQEYEALGKDYTCIDINGLDGALKLDFREPIDIGQFDVLTNFGCSEHVTEQKPCWENMHNMIKLGGHLCFVMPAPHNWLHHEKAYWYPFTQFYYQFATQNGYRLELFFESEETYSKKCYCGRMKKEEDRPFCWEDLDYLLWQKDQI